MTPSQLFTPFRSGQLELANRIVTASMCQCSAEHGCMPNRHLGQRALSGASLADRRGDDRHPARGQDHLCRRWPLVRRDGSGNGTRPRQHPTPLQYAFCGPTRPCRAQGVQRSSVEGRGTDRSHWRKGMANSCPFGACASAEREPAGCARRRALRQHLHLFDK